MSYALFDHDTELSRGFESYEAAFKHADEAGLTEKRTDKPKLIDGYKIVEIEEAVADDETAKDWAPHARGN